MCIWSKRRKNLTKKIGFLFIYLWELTAVTTLMVTHDFYRHFALAFIGAALAGLLVSAFVWRIKKVNTLSFIAHFPFALALLCVLAGFFPSSEALKIILSAPVAFLHLYIPIVFGLFLIDKVLHFLHRSHKQTENNDHINSITTKANQSKAHIVNWVKEGSKEQ